MSRMAARYDWEQAFAYWVELGEQRTFQRVADHLGTRKKTVLTASQRLGWMPRLQEIERRAQAEVDTRLVRDRADRIADTLRIIDAARTRFAGQLRRADFRLTGSDFVGLIKLEQLLEGEPTGRIEIGDVQAIITAVFTVAGRFVPADSRDQFMREVDVAVGGLAVLEGGAAA